MAENKDHDKNKQQNQQTGKSPQSGHGGAPGQPQSGGGQEQRSGQQSGGQGGATGTQRQQDPSGQGQAADEDVPGQQNQFDEKQRKGGQTQEPGLPEGNDEPWSPASENKDR